MVLEAAERSGPGAPGKLHQAPLAVGQDGLGLSKVNHGRGEQADAGMTMLFVIPGEKLLTEGAAVLDAAEAVRELRTVFHGPELAF
jgi:hypothetical protein